MCGDLAGFIGEGGGDLHMLLPAAKRLRCSSHARGPSLMWQETGLLPASRWMEMSISVASCTLATKVVERTTFCLEVCDGDDDDLI